MNDMATNPYRYADISDYPAQDFEVFCCNILARIFKLDIIQTKFSKDGGKDLIIAADDGGLVYVQCKAWSNPVGVDEMRKFLYVCNEDGVEGMFVSTSGYTRDAIAEAERKGLALVDFADLCLFGEKIGPKVYHFGHSPPRTMHPEFVGTFRITNSRSSGPIVAYFIDGFEEPRYVEPGATACITMIRGPHKLSIVCNKSGAELEFELDAEDSITVMANRMHGFICEYHGEISEFK